MSTKIKIRRDIKQNWQQHNPVLGDGEIALIKDTGEIKIGNGQSRVMEIPSINNNFNGYAWECIFEKNIGEELPTQFDLDISGSDRLLIENECQGYPDGDIYLRFNDDSNANYYTQYVYGKGSDALANSHNFDKIGIFNNANFDWSDITHIFLNTGSVHMTRQLYYSSYRYAELQTYKYKGNLPVTKITLYADSGIDNVSIKIFKRVQIVAQAPYKKLVASASKIKDIDGLVINVDQDKKYEIEMSCNQQTSQKVCFLINNDNGSNYIRRYRGVWDANSFSSGQQNLAYISVKWTSDSNQTHRGILYPFSKTYNCFYSRMNNSGQGYFENWNDTYLYQGGNIQTLNFIAPNDDITCRFKVWEITY